jgi:prevent-host-death family protein
MKSKSKNTKEGSVNVATLKAELAKYLRLVEAGNEVVVLHHNAAIAKIIPYSQDQELSLESKKASVDFSEIAKMKPPKRRQNAKVDSLKLLLEERGER